MLALQPPHATSLDKSQSNAKVEASQAILDMNSVLKLKGKGNTANL